MCGSATLRGISVRDVSYTWGLEDIPVVSIGWLARLLTSTPTLFMNCCLLGSDFADSPGEGKCSGTDSGNANGEVTGSESRHA